VASRKTLAFLIIYLSFTLAGFGQKELYSFNQLSFEQGLPGVNIRHIYQDSRGIMWISIEAIGLCKFYGNRYVLFQKDNKDSLSISSNFVNKVIEDKDGFLWVATDNGLNKYDRESNTFTPYLEAESMHNDISSNVINTLFIDSENNLWIGTENGLNKFVPEKNSFEYFGFSRNSEEVETATSIYEIFEDENGLLWLGTTKGLIKFNPRDKNYKSFPLNRPGSDLLYNFIRSIEVDNLGNLWLGTHRGLERFDPKKEEFIPWSYQPEDKKELIYEGINDIYNENDEQLWIGTYTKGIVLLNLKDHSYIRLNTNNNDIHGLTSNHIRYFLKDKSGTLWVCSKFEGLFRQEKSKEIVNVWPKSLSPLLPLKDKHILALYKDPQNEKLFWVGTKFDGLYRVDILNGDIRQYKNNLQDPTSVNSNRIQSVARTSDGKFYVATVNGLDFFDEENETFEKISNITINVIEADHNGRLWVGAFNGLFVMQNNKISRYQHEEPFFRDDSKDILQVYLDNLNNLWLSTRYDGLRRINLNSNEFTSYKHDRSNQQSISGNMVRPIYMDGANRLWVGTKAGGLNLMNDVNDPDFIVYTTSDGLPVNFILGIQEDLENNVWLSTFNGLSKFDLQTKTFTNFNKDYGLQGNIYELGVSEIHEDGSLIFGGHNGLDAIHPDSISKYDAVSPLIISSVDIYNEQFVSDIVANDTFELDHKQNYLSFEFVLADYTDYQRHQFSYQLVGVDNDWVQSGNRNYVSYSDLNPGSYTFKVKGANEFGTWNEDGPQLLIRIKPPFFNTAIFKFAVALALIITGLSFYLIKTRQIRNSKRFLEQKIQERTRKLREALDQLKENQQKIKSQNDELSTRNEQILQQSQQIQSINHELQQAHKELKSINNDLDKRVRDRTAELVKSNEELDRFVYSASHDLSAPLKSVLGLVNIAKLENKNGDLSLHFNLIEKSIVKLEEVINSLTQFSRNAGHDIIKKEFVFENLIREILQEHQASFRTGQSNVNLKFDPSMTIYTDYLRLKIILSNIISNAIKHTKNDCSPTIDINFARNNGEYEISVRDNGVGIKNEYKDKIFEMFYRANETSEGSGLGLYIVKETLAKLNGSIEIESEVNEYSEFKIHIPAN